MMKKTTFFFLNAQVGRLMMLLLLCCGVIHPASAKRVALVIGNADYSVGRLNNPVNDARSLTKSLRDLGFIVLYKPNLASREAMELAVEEFAAKISGADIALFYYSGHGVQRKGNNYLMPTKATINKASHIRHRAMNVAFLMDEMTSHSSGLNLVILDACRDDPYPRDSKSGATKGLGRMDAPSSTIIAYATKPNATAADGSGLHSPYTLQLLRHLKTQADQPIDDLLNSVSVEVENDTQNQQSPRLEMSPLRGDYCFATCAGKQQALEPLHFTVKTTPADARVRILNIGPVYQDGMLLKPGTYKVEVSKSGYQRQLSDFFLTAEKNSYYVELQAIIDPVKPIQTKGFTDPITGMKFVSIKSGCFQMGSPENEVNRRSDEKQHRVCLSQDYYLGQYEVTQAQWQQVMGDNPSKHKGANYPVERVGWNEIQEFIGKLNQKSGVQYRLPTEAEWEYAARAGTTTPFYTGLCITTDQANYDGSYDYNGCGAKTGVYREETIKVGSFPANPWGLYDMIGNVWELTCSKYDKKYSEGEKQCLSKIQANKYIPYAIRGGSFRSIPAFSRMAMRGWAVPKQRFFDRGFRLARTYYSFGP